MIFPEGDGRSKIISTVLLKSVLQKQNHLLGKKLNKIMILNSNTIINNLHTYLLILNEIESQEQAHLHAIGKSAYSFHRSVTLRYNELTLILDLKLPEEKFSQPYFECSLKIENQNLLLHHFNCENRDREKSIKALILQNLPAEFPSEDRSVSFGKEIADYLNIADEIAKPGYQYSSGDDYYPGYYSEVAIEDSLIILKQVNHWNSRSINHKDNYHLRDLEFYIPIGSGESKSFFQSEKIGKMTIVLSDSFNLKK